MNYPLWDLQASGLLIAIVSILHVFVSHFAIGGGLFLVVLEHQARRGSDAALLGYVRHHSRFFLLLTLVFGAISGVGIWFAITLVHPAATSSLINIFVWAWAIEWTLFLAEVAAAMVYYYGWNRLSPRQHLAVGWIYFATAYLSLVVINGILSFMLTPGRWLFTHRFSDGFFNPTYWSSLTARTLACVGLAGLYAIFTASFLKDSGLKRRVARAAGMAWVLPMAVALPLSLAWYFHSASAAGVGLAEIFGVPSAGFGSLLAAAFTGPAAPGYPAARMALRVAVIAMAAALLATLYVVLLRRERYGRLSATLLLACGLLSIGGGEWVREDLRKPFVIGGFMFVNGVRLPAPAGAPRPPLTRNGSHGEAQGTDPFSLDTLRSGGLLAASKWARLPGGVLAGEATSAAMDPGEAVEMEERTGAEVFRLSCSACHTLDSYHAVRPLVKGKSSSALEGMIHRFATPPGGAASEDWAGAGLRVATWRGRRMPPFAGTDAEARALSVYLAPIGGGEITPPTPPPPSPESHAVAARFFEENCAPCHGPAADWPMEQRLKGRSARDFYNLLGRLPQLNPNMPPFAGSDAERRALSEYLAAFAAARGKGEGIEQEHDRHE